MFERFLSSSNIHEQFLPPLSESSLLEALLFLLTPNTVGFEQDDRHDDPSEGCSGTWHPFDTVGLQAPLSPSLPRISPRPESRLLLEPAAGDLLLLAYGRSTMKLGLLHSSNLPPFKRAA